ncbi:Immunity protein 35 [Kibdelosporangium persicum]
MSHKTQISAADHGDTSNRRVDGGDFATSVAEMVADQAPPMFAVVLEFGDGAEAEIVAWGMVLDDSTYMVTVDGKNQYVLAEPENAVRYIRGHSDITPHLVWAGPSAARSHG